LTRCLGVDVGGYLCGEFEKLAVDKGRARALKCTNYKTNESKRNVNEKRKRRETGRENKLSDG
jgi:hypothetical protein